MVVGCNLKKDRSVFDDTERVLSLSTFIKVFCGNIYKENYFNIFNHMYRSIDRGPQQFIWSLKNLSLIKISCQYAKSFAIKVNIKHTEIKIKHALIILFTLFINYIDSRSGWGDRGWVSSYSFLLLVLLFSYVFVFCCLMFSVPLFRWL